jgi:hypothetical protein
MSFIAIPDELCLKRPARGVLIQDSDNTHWRVKYKYIKIAFFRQVDFSPFG